MSKTLVILESKSKISKVQKYLGNNYLVKASNGHIRGLHEKELSIDIDNNFKPSYKISIDKKTTVKYLKEAYSKCDNVLLACDFDREGESISWHLAEVLKIKQNDRKRLLFTEITEKAIKEAVKNPKQLDMNMFYAQQSRRLLDRIIGWTLCPILWKHIQNSYEKGKSISGGRVQSVVLRLIIDREKEIESFTSKNNYKVQADFEKDSIILKCNLNKDLENYDNTVVFLKTCKKSSFKIKSIDSINSTRKPPPPFITSSLQQEASNKFKMSPKLTMKIAQTLYENGYITYMRTDSVTLSKDAQNSIKDYITDKYGVEYLNIKNYSNKDNNCQEAHEAIRPSNININDISNDSSLSPNEYKLYKLIWNRTIASQMSPAKIEITTVTITADKLDNSYLFKSKLEKILFEGFQKIYTKYKDLENDSDEVQSMVETDTYDSIKLFKAGDSVNRQNIIATEKYTKPSHMRFTEASLIKKLDELGIGRPSTYSNMVSIVQERNYVVKKDIEGKNIPITILELCAENSRIKETKTQTKIGGEKQKLVSTDIGNIVNSFMVEHFSNIIDYKFTSNLEEKLDKIAKGKLTWYIFLKDMYDTFKGNSIIVTNKPILEKTKHKRVLGKYPNTSNDILVYIGQYGPVVSTLDKDGSKRFASLKDISLNDITRTQALELLKYPFKIGVYKDNEIILKNGKYGEYITYKGKNYNTGEETDITLEKAIDLINTSNKKKPDSNIIKKINKDIIVKSGPYGAYISYKGKHNVKIYNKDPVKITEKECIELINKKFKN